MKAFAEKTFKKACDVETGDGCAPNEPEFIEKNKAKSAAEMKEERTSREAELKDIRKQKASAEAEHKKKVKDWDKCEKAIQKSLTILKHLEKQKKKDEL